jgi:hypothetical protein
MHTLRHEERLHAHTQPRGAIACTHSAMRSDCSSSTAGHPKIWIIALPYLDLATQRFGSERLLQRGGQARAQLRCDAHDPN